MPGWLVSGKRDLVARSTTEVALVVEGREASTAFPPIEIGPPAPKPEPVMVEIKPEPLPFKAGEPLSMMALVARPASIPGVVSWTIETRAHRCGGVQAGLAYDPRGRVLATYDSCAIRLWDTSTGDLIRILGYCSPREVTSVASSPDSEFLAAGAYEAVHVWQVNTGRLVKTLQSGATSLAWSPDGRLLRTIVRLPDQQYAVISPEGQYRGSPGVEKELVYVVQTDRGQETLTPEEFSKKYGWKNDPQKAGKGMLNAEC